MVLVGDFWQLPGVDSTKACDSPAWHRFVRKKELHTMRRCQCDILKQKLEILRTGKPSVAQLSFIKAGHKAPTARTNYRMKEPTAWDIHQTLVETPDTTFLTCTKAKAALLNRWAVASLFKDERPLAHLSIEGDMDVKANHGSYEIPKLQRIYKGMRITLTRNLNKDIGYVNGMGATVIDMCNNGPMVRTDQGRTMLIWQITDFDENANIYKTFFPFRLGYASTLHKVQGATLKHITLWLDLANMEAAGYVALSRVQKDANWRFLGDPTRHYFTPAKFKKIF